MLKYYATILLTVFAQLCVAQITYSYDNSGNRNKRDALPTAPTGCYTMMIPGFNKFLTNVNGVLKVKTATNSDTQKWKLETSGAFVKVVAATNNQALGVAGGGNSEGDLITLQANGTQEYLLWTKTVVPGSNPEANVFIRNGSSLIFGSTLNWGDGDPSDLVTDIRLTNDPSYMFGANKWILENATCPTSSGRQGVTEEADLGNTNFVVSPNPSSGELRAAFYLAPGRIGDLSVTNLAGKVIYQKRLVGEGNHVENISLQSLNSGLYIVSFISENSVKSKKISVEK